MPFNSGAGEDSWASLDSKEIKPVNPKGNQPWIFIEGLMLNLQYFGHLMRRVNTLGKNLGKDTGKDWGQEGKGVAEDEMLDSITDSMDMSLSKLQEIVKDTT